MAQILAQCLPKLIDETPLSALATVTFSEMQNLPARLDDQTLARCQAIADSPLPPMRGVTMAEFSKVFRGLRAVLAMRNTDDSTAELMLAIYHDRLGQYPREAIEYMAREAITRDKWFPAISDCLTILDGWKRHDEPKRLRSMARRAVTNESIARHADMQEAFWALRANQVPQDQVDAWPLQWRKSADAQGLLRYDGERYAVRDLLRPLGEVA